MKAWALSILIVLGACGGKGGSVEHSASTADPAAAPSAAGPERDARWAAWFGDKPSLSEPFSGLTLGMTRDEVIKLLGKTFGTVPGEPQLEYRIPFSTSERYGGVAFRLPKEGLAVLESRWGKGQPVAEGSGDLVWLDPTTRVRAAWQTVGSELVLGPYTPAEDALPPRADTIFGQAVALLGKPTSEVSKAFPAARDLFGDGSRFEVEALVHPATLTAPLADLSLNTRAGVVASVYVRFDLIPGASERIRALAKERLGPPTESRVENIVRYTHTHDGLELVLEPATDASTEDLHLTIRRP